MPAVVELHALVERLRLGRVILGAEELEARQGRCIPSGLEQLDALLGGGFPVGKAVELISRPGGATTALAWSVLAHATSTGHLAALVDPSDALHPRSAAEAGIALERLLWCRPQSMVETLRSADVLLAAGAFPLVVIDLTRRAARADPPAGPRNPSRLESRPVSNEAWLRLIRRAEAGRSCLVVLTGEGLSLSSFASATLAPGRSQARFVGRGAGRTFEGVVARFELARNKLGLPTDFMELSLASPRCFPAEAPAPGPSRGDGRAGSGPVARRPRVARHRP